MKVGVQVWTGGSIICRRASRETSCDRTICRHIIRLSGNKTNKFDKEGLSEWWQHGHEDYLFAKVVQHFFSIDICVWVRVIWT
jgi:hypothetical protein